MAIHFLIPLAYRNIENLLFCEKEGIDQFPLFEKEGTGQFPSSGKRGNWLNPFAGICRDGKFPTCHKRYFPIPHSWLSSCGKIKIPHSRLRRSWGIFISPRLLSHSWGIGKYLLWLVGNLPIPSLAALPLVKELSRS